jgi:hypothetical protein
MLEVRQQVVSKSNLSSFLEPLTRAEQNNQAPLIDMISNSRLENMGNFVEFTCHAVGKPHPQISWSVIDEENSMISYPLSKYAGIYVSPRTSIKGNKKLLQVTENNHVLIDTRRLRIASFLMRCNATNIHGEDSSLASLVALEAE